MRALTRFGTADRTSSACDDVAALSFMRFRELLPMLTAPIQDQRDGRGRAFVHGEIDQEPLPVGRDGLLLLVRTRGCHGTADNVNGEQGLWGSGFQGLPLRR